MLKIVFRRFGHLAVLFIEKCQYGENRVASSQFLKNQTSFSVSAVSKQLHFLNFIFCFSGVIDTAETDFGDFRSDYL
jgi:hypothetical protein